MARTNEQPEATEGGNGTEKKAKRELVGYPSLEGSERRYIGVSPEFEREIHTAAAKALNADPNALKASERQHFARKLIAEAIGYPVEKLEAERKAASPKASLKRVGETAKGGDLAGAKLATARLLLSAGTSMEAVVAILSLTAEEQAALQPVKA